MIQPKPDAIYERAPLALAILETRKDESGRPVDAEFIAVNREFETLFQKTQSEMIGHRFREFFHVKELSDEDWMHRVLQALSENGFYAESVSGISHSKTLHFQLFSLSEDQIGCSFQENRAGVPLQEKLEGFLAVSLDMFMIGSPEGRFVKVNQQFESVLGYSPKELEGHSFSEFLHPDDIDQTQLAVEKLIAEGGIQKLINRLVAKNGEIKTLEWRAFFMGSVFYASARDITEQVRKEEQLRREAEIDPLTGLFNRHYLYQRIQEEITLSEKRNTPLSMIAVDIDHFKYVNDIWGHPVGDEVLEQTANLMKSAIEGPDFLARIGGEEFVALLPGSKAERALSVAQKMHAALNEHPHPRVGKVTASFGVALREPGEDFLQWYKRADEAVYSAKRSGRNRVVMAGETPLETPLNSIYMAWKEVWNSGNLTIDAQHRELIDVGNHLIFLAVSGAVPQQISRQLDRLLVHVANHFATEESILSQTGFSGLEEHQNIHKDLLRRTGELAADFLRQPTQSPIFLSFMINDLIIGHLSDEDVKFFPYLLRQDA